MPNFSLLFIWNFSFRQKVEKLKILHFSLVFERKAQSSHLNFINPTRWARQCTAGKPGGWWWFCLKIRHAQAWFEMGCVISLFH